MSSSAPQHVTRQCRPSLLACANLRNDHGTRHGRTLPTALREETAVYVVREAVHVAELMLSTYDRQMSGGRV